MDFSTALKLCKSGSRIARRGWNGKGMYVAVQVPDAGSANTLPYLYLKTAQGGRVPWTISQTDALSEDWELADVELKAQAAEYVKAGVEHVEVLPDGRARAR